MTRPDRRDRITLDWTMDPVTKRSNSSAEYQRLVKEVEQLIRGSAHSLITGDVSCVASLIVSQLAHVHGLRPDVEGLRSEGAHEPPVESAEAEDVAEIRRRLVETERKLAVFVEAVVAGEINLSPTLWRKLIHGGGSR